MYCPIYPRNRIRVEGFVGLYLVEPNPEPGAGYEHSRGYSPWDDGVFVSPVCSFDDGPGFRLLRDGYVDGPFTQVRTAPPLYVERTAITGVY